MDRPLSFGQPSALQFVLRWETAQPTGTAADATRGRLIVSLDGRPVWGATVEEPEGFSWTWIELVEYLTRHWVYLFVEEGDPLGLGAPPERLRAKAEERWTGCPAEQQALEEERLFAYLESHDLSSAVHGAYPAPLWLTREGNALRVACKRIVAFVPIETARATMSALGDAIVARAEAVRDDPRSKVAKAAWEAREKLEPLRLAQVATGLEEDTVRRLADLPSLPLAGLRFDQAFRPDEYLAVARMAGGALPPEELEVVLATIAQQGPIATDEVDRLSADAAEMLDDLRDRQAFDQGRALARWLREQLAVSDDVRISPAAVLAEWGVPVVDIVLSSRELDAVSIWGSKHGPTVLVNRNGRHGRRNGRRATLAHEVAHMILDRRDALPVAEVMGGAVSRRVEMRARAFAAELLVPEVAAGRAILDATGRADLVARIRRVGEWYGASHEIVAWQAYNAHDRRVPEMVRTYLKSLVSNPDSF